MHLTRRTTKPAKWLVRPVKTQLSLGIRPVWSESSLSAWRKLGSLTTHWAHSEDSDRTMRRLIWIFAGSTCHFVGFVVLRLIYSGIAIFEVFPSFLCDVDDAKGSYMSRDMTKPTKWMCAQWRLRSAWASAQSDHSLCAQWIAKDPDFLRADSEDSDQTGRMPRLIWVFAGRTLILLVFSCRGSVISILSELVYGDAHRKVGKPRAKFYTIKIC